MQELVSHQLVRYLERRGVSHIFGLCGHSNIAVLTALSNSPIRFVSVRHEQVATHMADAYARLTRRASVVLSHLGPGLTNAATGVATAALDSIPMVVISGDIPSYFYGRNPHQEINLHADAAQWEIFRPFVKRAWRVDRADRFAAILERAFETAETGRPGPVLVSVPMDFFSAEVDRALFDSLGDGNRDIARPTLSAKVAKQIMTVLEGARNPVIYAGGGVLLADAADELRQFADQTGIPVAHSLMGKGALPDDHPLTLGMTGFWGTEFVNRKCRTADAILALGTRFCEADCSSWDPTYTFDMAGTKLIHIDIDPVELGRNYAVTIGAVADLKEALSALLAVANRTPARDSAALAKEIADYRRNFRAGNADARASDAWPMRPERILEDVRSLLPRDAIITTDVGWNKNGVGQQFPVYTPGTVLTPGGYATMGFGAPAAMGAKLARPGQLVVSLVGDGGFGQNPALLATAVEENIPVIWVVMNNCAYGTIAGLQKAHYNTTVGTVFEVGGQPYSPDFAAIARGFGVDGVKVERADQFRPTLEAAIASGRPCVIDVQMQNAPVPTDGHWDIMDIYSPGEKKSHVST